MREAGVEGIGGGGIRGRWMRDVGVGAGGSRNRERWMREKGGGRGRGRQE